MAHIAKLGAQTDEFISAFTGWPTQVSCPPQTLTVRVLQPCCLSTKVEIQMLMVHLEQICKVQCKERCSSQDIPLWTVPTSQPIRC